jgi:ribosomal protein S18 acetylase RimI-like enzyme
MEIRRLAAADRSWLDELVAERWGAPVVVSRGRVHRPAELPGFVAHAGADLFGLLTYEVRGDECEVVTIDSLVEDQGVGSALLAAAKDAAAAAGCRRLWLITTNDNLRALGFYQKRGFALAALHRGALEESRRLKPSIPVVGLDGIPLRDELELELLL